MNKEDLVSFLKIKAKENGIELSTKQVEELYLYMITLKEWNEKINLTAIKEDKEIIIKHFIDSIVFKDKIVRRKDY